MKRSLIEELKALPQSVREALTWEATTEASDAMMEKYPLREDVSAAMAMELWPEKHESEMMELREKLIAEKLETYKVLIKMSKEEEDQYLERVENEIVDEYIRTNPCPPSGDPDVLYYAEVLFGKCCEANMEARKRLDALLSEEETTP